MVIDRFMNFFVLDNIVEELLFKKSMLIFILGLTKLDHFNIKKNILPNST